MKSTRLFISGAVILFVCSSCSRYYYRPNGVNTPLFTDKGQAHLNVAGSIGSVDETNDYDGTRHVFDLQASVSPIKHVGIIANYSTYGYTPDEPDVANGNVDGRAHLLEFGVGGYYAKGNMFKMVADCYAGYGAGRIRSDVDMHMHRFFLQPGIGVHSPVFDASFNLRLVSLRYNHFDAKGRSEEYLMANSLINSSGRRIDNTNYVFAEPSFTVRTGYKFIKAQLQLVFAREMTSVPWDYNPSRYTVGLYFSLEDAIAGTIKSR